MLRVTKQFMLYRDLVFSMVSKAKKGYNTLKSRNTIRQKEVRQMLQEKKKVVKRGTFAGKNKK